MSNDIIKQHIIAVKETYEYDLKDLNRTKQPSGFHKQKIDLVEGFITELNEMIKIIDNGQS